MHAVPTEPQTTDFGPRFDHEPEAKAFYTWLALNGVTEWIPQEPTIVVDTAAKTITYPSWRWVDDQRGFNVDYLAVDGDGMPITEARTVPLIVPVTDELRRAAARAMARSESRVTLIES